MIKTREGAFLNAILLFPVMIFHPNSPTKFQITFFPSILLAIVRHFQIIEIKHPLIDFFHNWVPQISINTSYPMLFKVSMYLGCSFMTALFLSKDKPKIGHKRTICFLKRRFREHGLFQTLRKFVPNFD